MAKTKCAHFFNGLSVFIIEKSKDFDTTGNYELAANFPLFTVGDTFSNCWVSGNINRLDYPTTISSYYDYVLPFFKEESGIVSHNALLRHIEVAHLNDELTKKEHYFFDCLPGYFDCAFISQKTGQMGAKGFFRFQVELSELFYLVDKNGKPFLFTNEVMVMEVVDRSVTFHHFEKTRAFIDNTIRTKNYFLNRLPNEEVDKIVQSIFYEMLEEEHQNECIIQDTLIRIEDEDYTIFIEEYEKELHMYMSSFFEKYPEGFLIDAVLMKNAIVISKNVEMSLKDKKIKCLDFCKIIDILCDYRKLNYSMTKTLYRNSGRKGLDLAYANDNFIRTCGYLTNAEKTDYRRMLRKIVDKLKSIDPFTTIVGENED